MLKITNYQIYLLKEDFLNRHHSLPLLKIKLTTSILKKSYCLPLSHERPSVGTLDSQVLEGLVIVINEAVVRQGGIKRRRLRFLSNRR